MDDKKIQRINELARKSKAEGLTSAERKEQKLLREEFIADVRRNLRGQLDNISIQEKDGSITNLGEKFGNREKYQKTDPEDPFHNSEGSTEGEKQNNL